MPIRLLTIIMLCFLLVSSPFVYAESGSGHNINADMAKSKARPTVSAENVNYHEDTGLYALAGNVRIKLAERTFLTQTARINPVSLLLWTDGGSEIIEGELHFTCDAMYAELSGNTVWCFGTRCGVERPGLVIHGDNMQYNWDSHIVTFDGHVLCVQKGKSTTASHLEFDLDKNDIVR
jgi:lipopolysaccharide export system protein LptA